MNAPPVDHWMVSNVEGLQAEGEYLAQAIRSGKCLAISDGSYKHDISTSACVIEGQDGAIHRITGLNRVPGSADCQSAYRAELSGISCILAIIEAIRSVHNITQGGVTLGLDGESALKQAFGHKPLTSDQPSFDLLTDIRRRLKSSPLKFTSLWVRGHQLEKTGEETYEGTLNNICDLRAKAFRRTFEQHRSFSTQRFGKEGWSMRIDGQKKDRVDPDLLYDITFGQRSQRYWSLRQDISTREFKSINWPSLGTAMHQWAFGKQKWMAKHLSGFSATGRVMKRRKEWDHDRCPRCEKHNEDATHILTCRNPSARQHWLTSVSTFSEILTKQKTHPDILRVIISRLKTWSYPSNENFRYTSMDDRVRKALYEQDRIGWTQFLYGRLTSLWLDPQDRWLVSIATKWKRSLDRWFVQVIKGVMEIPWQMWEHRNNYYHDPLHPWRLTESEFLDNTIRTLYNQFSSLLYLESDWRYFETAVDDFLPSLSLSKKSSWIESVELAQIRKQVSDPPEDERITTGLTNWLQTPPPGPAIALPRGNPATDGTRAALPT